MAYRRRRTRYRRSRARTYASGDVTKLPFTGTFTMDDSPSQLTTVLASNNRLMGTESTTELMEAKRLSIKYIVIRMMVTGLSVAANQLVRYFAAVLFADEDVEGVTGVDFSLAQQSDYRQDYAIPPKSMALALTTTYAGMPNSRVAEMKLSGPPRMGFRSNEAIILCTELSSFDGSAAPACNVQIAYDGFILVRR